MQRAFPFGISAACSFLMLVASTSALAKPASVFMLQFGSFESTDEANQRVSSLKSKHAGLIGNMGSRVQEVALPDNLTVYRTQAGPVASRAEAQSICAQLASNGDECYVVETAMSTQPAATQVAKAAAAPASVSFSKPNTPAPTIETLNAASAAQAVSPAVKMPPLPTPAAKADMQVAAMESKLDAAKSAPTTARDDARKTIASEMSAVKALESAPPITKATTLKPSLPDTDKPVVKTASAPEGDRPSFWSRMNPFSDDDAPDAKQAKVTQPKVETAIAKVDATEVAAMEVKKPALPPVETPRVTAPAAAVQAPVAATDGRTPVMLPAKQVADASSSLPLPPPPAMNDSAKQIFARNQQEAPRLVPEQTGNVPTIAATGQPAATNAPFSNASNETLARVGKPVTTTAGDGSVKVGEAQRVPLSQATQMPADGSPMYVPSGSSVAPPDASIPIRTTPRGITPPAGELAAPEVALPASQNTAKTLWAELGPYRDAPAALAFWDKFRSKNPDFPVVRVRVIQSYAQQTRGDSNVQLRVGPFAKPESISYLCGQFKDVYSLKCGPVTDMGVSSSQSDARSRVMQGEANLATQSMNANNAPQMQGTYWLQLGSYPSLPQAQNTWADLKNRYASAMAGMNPNIAVPPLSSGQRPTYRLRGGPFTSELAATKACLALKSAGGNCLVSGN